MKTKKPGKQRRKLYQAPLHKRGKHLSAPLSSELKSRFKTSAVPIRRGDTVRILRGDRRGFEGRITRVDRKNYRVFIEGISRDRADGTTTLIPIHASKVIVTSLNLDDRRRRNNLERKAATVEAELPEERLEEKVEEVEETTEAKEGRGT